MPITNYSTLVTALDGKSGYLHRSDVTAKIPDWIALAESDMQVRCKLLEFETTATVSVTAGAGSLPSDFVGMRSIYWDGNTKVPLDFIAPARFDLLRNVSGEPRYYTLVGTQVRVAPSATGNVAMTYQARFTAISSTMGTNSIINNFPEAYLYGAMAQAAIWEEDDEKATKYLGLMDAAVSRIRSNNTHRKYAGATLQVRPR